MTFIFSKRRLLKVICLVSVTFVFVFGMYTNKDMLLQTTTTQPVGYVALVIDDFGNDGDGTEAMLNVGVPITAAVMPFMPYSQSEADAAHKAGVEVIMHVPLEPEHGKPEWLGPRGITCDLSDAEIRDRINDGLDEIKWAAGMNNHMGSKATADSRVMKIIMEIAKERDLYYLDSKTTPKSVVEETAIAAGVPFFERRVFLDNVKSQAAIEKQLRILGDLALEDGYAIGIGHVGPEGGTITVQAIKAVYPELEKKGVRFVKVSELKKLTQ